ncbi:PREDICTED: uncharacterized protein LOC106120687 isoform X2 [Papilio xuthus]|uniref:Uncharacterized protein LOC106120687 isoform X2 n=1 Tax=Papilio xuthus TaxID=66420 RepID=A0AAJ7EC76_PAPXU|nr:PREDICTED: uncharacterized protein LOC106120687 isoform X2 [Papilio xuthus]
MKVMVLYFMVFQNCLHIVLPQELSTELTNNVVQEKDTTIYGSTTKSANENDPREPNKLNLESFSSSNPTNDEEANNGLDYPFKTLMRLLSTS